jgi:DHA2 family multidrug resistance protein
MVVTVVGAIQGAGLYIIPQYLRHVQDYSAAQTGSFVSAYTAGLVLGLSFTLLYLSPRFGNIKAIAFGALLMFACCVNFLYIWTPTTPMHVLMPSLFLQGFALGPMILGTSFASSSQASLSEMNDVTTSYYFVRQLGNTFGITAATVIFDFRMTLHSSRLLDVANALDPRLQSTLSQYTSLIERNGGAGSNPALGAVQIFQTNVITQSELLSYMDIYWGLAVLSAVALFLVVFARPQGAAKTHLHFHPW